MAPGAKRLRVMYMPALLGSPRTVTLRPTSACSGCMRLWSASTIGLLAGGVVGSWPPTTDGARRKTTPSAPRRNCVRVMRDILVQHRDRRPPALVADSGQFHSIEAAFGAALSPIPSPLT